MGNDNRETPKLALVTGASRGIGKAVALELVNKGYRVIGTSRNPSAIADNDLKKVTWLSLDLLNSNSINNLVTQINNIDVLVNNAGSSQMGPVEDVSIEKIMEQFSINFFGHVQLIKAVLPKMREQGSGKILNITSFASRFIVPFSSVYAASKAAMETLTRGLRNEVKQYGIDVIAVAPTFVKTEIHQEKILETNSVYNNDLNKVKRIRDSNIENGTEPKAVAKEIIRIINIDNPKPFYAVGSQAKLFAFMYKFLPSRLIERVIRNRFKLKA